MVGAFVAAADITPEAFVHEFADPVPQGIYPDLLHHLIREGVHHH
jgi:hypothetical protein